MDPAIELGPIRPPSEARSLLIRVTRNCPWNQCEFCHTYKGEKFSLRPLEEIKKEIDCLKEMAVEIQEISWKMGFAGALTREVLGRIFGPSARYGPAWQNVAGWLHFGGTQVFLQDANSLILKTSVLAEILRYLKDQFPSIERITSYARAKTLARKSVPELKELHAAGLSRIHIGMETGYDPLLLFIKKGVTSEEQIRAGKNVVDSGISLSEYVMPGLGGGKWWREHTLATARVLNQIDPDYIRLRSLYIRPNMPLYRKVEKGEFHRLADDQVVTEIRLFLETLDGIQSTVVSDHVLNLLEEVQGKLPREKEKMIALIDRYLALGEEERLLFRVGRRLGYCRSLDDLEEQDLRRRIRAILDELGQSKDGPMKPDQVEKEIYRGMENYI